MRHTLVLAGLATAALFGCSDDDNTAKTFNLTLDKAQEVPVCAAAGANATGTAVIVVAADNSSITATVTYSGLSGPPIMAHLHSGTPSVAGPVVLPFTVALTSPYSQVFTAADYDNTGTGAPATFADFVNNVRAGNQAYTNVHTDACRPGEIRADIR
jgi:hypothetical protein